MSNRTQPKWTTIIALSVIVASLIALAMLAPQLIALIVTISNPAAIVTEQTPPINTPSPALIQARAVLARVRDEIIPHEGQVTSYGVTFSDAGYQTLIQ